MGMKEWAISKALLKSLISPGGTAAVIGCERVKRNANFSSEFLYVYTFYQIIQKKKE